MDAIQKDANDKNQTVEEERDLNSVVLLNVGIARIVVLVMRHCDFILVLVDKGLISWVCVDGSKTILTDGTNDVLIVRIPKQNCIDVENVDLDVQGRIVDSIFIIVDDTVTVRRGQESRHSLIIVMTGRVTVDTVSNI